MLNASSVYNEFVFSSVRHTWSRSNITSTLGMAKVGGLNLKGPVFFQAENIPVQKNCRLMICL